MTGGRLRAFCLFVAWAACMIAGCERTVPDVEAVDVRTTSHPADGVRALVVESERGTVVIRGESDREAIDVTATVRARGASREQAEARLAALDVSETRSDDALRLGFRVPAEGAEWAAAADLVVLVPLGTSIDVDGAEVAVTVGSVSGTLRIATETGDVVVRGADLERFAVESGTGDVEFSGRLVGTGAVHEVRSDRGDVHVRIPLDARLRIEASVSRRGIITSSLPLSGDTEGTEWSAVLNAPDATLRLETRDGRILIGRLHET